MSSSSSQHLHISAKKRVQHYDRASTAGKWIKRKSSDSSSRTAKKLKKTLTNRKHKSKKCILRAARTIQRAWARFLPRLHAARTIQGAWQRKVFYEFAKLKRTMPNVDCAFCGENMRDRRDVGIVLYASSESSKHHLTCVGTRNSPTCFTCMWKWLKRNSRCPHCREDIGVLSWWDDAYPDYINGRLKLRHRAGTFIDRRVPMPPTDGDAEMAMHLAGIDSDSDYSSSDDEPEPNQMANSWYVEEAGQVDRDDPADIVEINAQDARGQADVAELSANLVQDAREQADVAELSAQVIGRPIQVPVIAEMTRGERRRQINESISAIIRSEPEDTRTLATLALERSSLTVPRLPRRNFRPEYLAPALHLYRSNEPVDGHVYYYRGEREQIMRGDIVSFHDEMPTSPQVVECARRHLRGVVVRVGYDLTVFVLPHYGWFVIPFPSLNLEERATGDMWEQFLPIGNAQPSISEITFRNSVVSVALQWLGQHTRLCESRVEHERRLNNERHYYNDLPHVLERYKEFEDSSRVSHMNVISTDLLFEVCNLRNDCSVHETRHIISVFNSFDHRWLILDNCRLAIVTMFFKNNHFRTLLLNTVILNGGYHCSLANEWFALIAVAIIHRMFVHNNILFSTPFNIMCARRLVEAPEASYDELTLKQWMCVVHSVVNERGLETCIRRLTGWHAHPPLLRITDYDLVRYIMTIDSGPILERLRQMDVNSQSEFATLREWVRAGYFV